MWLAYLLLLLRVPLDQNREYRVCYPSQSPLFPAIILLHKIPFNYSIIVNNIQCTILTVKSNYLSLFASFTCNKTSSS